VLAAYDTMGRPAYPTRQQIAELRRAAALPPAEPEALSRGELTLLVPPQGLALIELDQK
jgi:xylan 1,4-beta-xylosidase